MPRSERWLRDAVWRLIKSRFPPKIAFRLSFIRGYRYYPYVFDVMRVLMDPARDTVDAGAHQGSYSWFFARYSRRVFSFEPNPENFRILSRLGARVNCYQAALSDEATEAELRVPCDEAGLILDEGGTIAGGEAKWAKRFQVKCLPLDAFELKDVGFLKIDVEGAEFAVLRGALRTITTSKPKMMVEINGDQTGEDRLRETVTWIEKLNYDCFFFSNRKLAAFRHFDLERDQLRPQRERDMRNYKCLQFYFPSRAEPERLDGCAPQRQDNWRVLLERQGEWAWCREEPGYK